jgi:hypothetical protein
MDVSQLPMSYVWSAGDATVKLGVKEMPLPVLGDLFMRYERNATISSRSHRHSWPATITCIGDVWETCGQIVSTQFRCIWCGENNINSGKSWSGS